MLNKQKIVAFICECNPFHEGHKRLIKCAKNEGDIIIAIMSGNFVQRGEVAVYDKYQRTKKLLKNGVSLVIELPVEYSLSSAKYFASYSISILNKLKFVDKLIFGSEINDIHKLNELAIKNLDLENNIDLKKYLKSGLSYSASVAKIYNKKLSSNDILAVEYISAIKKSKSQILPICIKRDTDLPTASELRKSIIQKISNDVFSSILNYKLLLAKNNDYDLSNTYLMNDSLYNSILKTATKNLTFTKRAEILKSKNITLSNIKRVLLNIVIGINKQQVNTSISKQKINYIRILGVKKDFITNLKYINVPFLLNYTNSAYKTLMKRFPKSKVISQNKNGTFKLCPQIKLNVFASDLYNYFADIKFTEATTKTLII